MEKCRLDFNKYKDRLKKIYPKYSNIELEELFKYKVNYWKILIDNMDI